MWREIIAGYLGSAKVDFLEDPLGDDRPLDQPTAGTGPSHSVP
jgi:hypothetical protein